MLYVHVPSLLSPGSGRRVAAQYRGGPLHIHREDHGAQHRSQGGGLLKGQYSSVKVVLWGLLRTETFAND